MMPSAKVIADSVAPNGRRVTTLEVVMHRFVLAEFNTHRMFSRNSASSRAIPFHKMAERVTDTPAEPVVWATEQKGMQGGPPLSDPEDIGDARRYWLNARDEAVESARRLVTLGVHKSIANRLLEPFMWHTVIVTSTEWDNFFGLRCHEMAQPEIRVAADAMQEAYNASEPHQIGWAGWHLPYVTQKERSEYLTVDLKKISVARCAWVSTMSHDGDHSVEACERMFDRLTTAVPMHASPLEHQARPMMPDDHQIGNLIGWCQYRHDIEAKMKAARTSDVQALR